MAVLGPHGAGFVNLLAAPQGCAVLELMPRTVPRGAVAYWSLCGALGHDYAYLSCREVNTGHQEQDMMVDVDKVVRWCSTLA